MRALETFQKELTDSSVKCLRTIQKGKKGKCPLGLAVRGSLVTSVSAGGKQLV